MSMLTPLGTGGQSRRPRRWPRALAAVVALAAVAAGAYGAWVWLDHRSDSDVAASTPTTICRTPTVASAHAIPDPRAVSVAVANGTDRAGLAMDTADELAARGFKVTDIGNTEKAVRSGVAQVRYSGKDLAPAITVGSYVPGAQLIEVNRVQEATVGLWLGPDFDGVLDHRRADAEKVQLPQKDPVCHKEK